MRPNFMLGLVFRGSRRSFARVDLRSNWRKAVSSMMSLRCQISRESSTATPFGVMVWAASRKWRHLPGAVGTGFWAFPITHIVSGLRTDSTDVDCKLRVMPFVKRRWGLDFRSFVLLKSKY